MRGEPLTILLVEDNEDHAELVKNSFEDHRIANRMFHVTNGQAALDYLHRRGEYADPEKSPTPHVVLLDLRLPKVDGLAVLQQIKESEQLQKLPVVILTTSESEQDTAKAYAHRANSYLVKPVGFTEFSRMMDDLGFYWLSWNRHPWRPGGS